MGAVHWHGDAKVQMRSAPQWGRTVAAGLGRISVIPPTPFETHFCSPDDVISITTGRLTGRARHDSDKDGSLHLEPFVANFHPAGSSAHVRGDVVRGDALAVVIDPSLRSDLCAEGAFRAAKNLCAVRHGLSAPWIPNLAQALRRHLRSGAECGRILVESYAAIILANTLETIETAAPRRDGLDERCVSRVLDLVEARLAEDLSVQTLAQEAGLTASHFIRAFRGTVGMSPHQYVIERRIARAREALEAGRGTIADIAYAVGFSSQAHMTTTFKTRLGITPAAYRKDRLN